MNEKVALELLLHFHAFNTLTEEKVIKIGELCEIDAFKLANINGITYEII